MKLKHLFFLVFLTFSCSSPNDNLHEIINLKQAFENMKPVDINDIAKNFEYTRLETKDVCLTGAKLKVYSDDQYLIAIDRTKILLFDRKDGKFIREIGQMGDGPEQYSRTFTVMPYNEETKTVYAGRNKKRYEYSLDGQLKNTREIPGLVSEFGNIDENTIAAFLPNYQGNEKNKIIIINEVDSIIKIFPNYLSAPKTDGFFIWNPSSWFYRLNKQLYFYELFNDTLFHVSANSLTPRFIFNMGQYSPPYEMKTSPKFEVDKYFFIKGIFESSKYLLCTFGFNQRIYTALYDKDQKNTFVNDYTSESGNGYINNTNDFVPLELSSINERGELTCTIDTYKIMQWFKENPEKINQLPQYLKDLINLRETDNPVILIAKLKE